MKEIAESRGRKMVWDAKQSPACFTEEQEERIRKVYESKTRNKSERMVLRLKGNVYVFAYYGKKNRYLCCPETRFEFYPNGICCMTKDNPQGTSKEYNYYQF